MSDKVVAEYSVQFGKFIAKFVTEIEQEYRERVHLHSRKVTARDLVREYISEQMLYVTDTETGRTSAPLKVRCEIQGEILEAVKASSDPIALTNAIAKIV